MTLRKRVDGLICGLGVHRWSYGYNYEVDAFGYYKRCERCKITRGGIKVAREAIRQLGDTNG